ncbi:ArsR family transcriptional regulator [Leucobacter sp. OH2974_COT-288]|uniref:DNA-binding transcriptional ArsR family regulator n=1 Tax=Canibacter oris TaxID=1365628 RepID=A0A840DDB8_9MICO|nr:metalloregulator ArsR/SmtB family transcription factor [Canibacter oris]MBB4071451.1 DNA-binding transcriptional ArsR family regulator [Canibacter oris]RRD35716.1 ArsR family transcriptional regulator [Leucobacter sp. OH2974_COT-288]
MSDIFNVIADATRRDILVTLLEAKETRKDGELRVSDLVEELQISQPTVSKHLKVLRDAAVVTVREEGAARYYKLDVEPLQEVEDFVLSFLITDADAEITVEYISENGENLGDLESQSVLPEPVSQAAAEVGRAAALAAKPVKELVARFRLRG